MNVQLIVARQILQMAVRACGVLAAASYCAGQGLPPGTSNLEDYTIEYFEYTTLARPTTQKEIKLTESQKKSFLQIGRQTEEALSKLKPPASGSDPSSPTYMRKVREAITAAANKFLKSLTPTQAQRLKQLTLQALGPSMALRLTTVAIELQLTTAQRAKVKAQRATFVTESAKLNKEFSDSLSKLMPAPNKKLSEAEAKKRQAAVKKAMQQLTDRMTQRTAKLNADALSVLTPAQRTQWGSMLGKGAKV